MRVRGLWSPLGAVVWALFECPQLGIVQPVFFVLDPGAGLSSLSDPDGERLQLNYNALPRAQRDSVGLGGRVPNHVLPETTLVFVTEDGGIHEHTMSGFRARKHNPTGAEVAKLLPSLLGRDFTDHYTIVLNRRQDLVLITDELAPRLDSST